MSIGRVAAGCAGVLLLLPGLCFVGVGFFAFNGKNVGESIPAFVVGLGILVLAGGLVYIAFRKDEEGPTTIKHPTEPEPPKME